MVWYKAQDGNHRNRFHMRRVNFKGACEALPDCIFDLSDGKNVDKYINNLKLLATYVGQKYTDGGDIRYTIERMKRFEIEEPDALDTIPTEFKREVWKRKVAEYVRRNAQLKTNIRTAYILVWGQCTINMQNKLRAHEDFKTFDEKYDVLELLKAIKSCTYQIEQQKDSALTLVNAMKKFTLFYQGRSVSLEVHYERFNTLLEVLEGYGGELPVQPKQFNEELDYFDDNEKDIQANIYEAKAAANLHHEKESATLLNAMHK